MARSLARTVIVDGAHVPAGTVETAALSKSVTNPAAWVGEPDKPTRKTETDK